MPALLEASRTLAEARSLIESLQSMWHRTLWSSLAQVWVMWPLLPHFRNVEDRMVIGTCQLRINLHLVPEQMPLPLDQFRFTANVDVEVPYFDTVSSCRCTHVVRRLRSACCCMSLTSNTTLKTSAHGILLLR